MSIRGLTTEELAGRIDLGRWRTEVLLAEMADDGQVEQGEDGGWGLTAETEREYGEAFRALDQPESEKEAA
jgi:hypothetical protein